MSYTLITLGWKSLQNIKNVYEDALNSTLPPNEFVVIINPYDISETDKIISFVTKQEKTRYIICSNNIGIGVAWNLGMYISKTKQVIIVNDDCRVGKDTYKKIIDEFDKDDRIGGVGVKWGNPTDKRPTPEGFLIAFNLNMIFDIGGYKEFYNPLADERELCLRGWIHGWKSSIAEGCEYSHVHDISNNPYQPIPYLGDTLIPRHFQERMEPVIKKYIDEYNKRLS